MKKLELNKALASSLKGDVIDLSVSIADKTLEILANNNDFSGIPFISTAISMYKIGKDLHALHYIKKLSCFISEINNKATSQEEINRYIEKITKNQERSNKELEYLLICIDKYIEYNKARMLMDLYLAYLREYITWNELVTYSLVLENLITSDYEILKGGSQKRTNALVASDVNLRLCSLGFMFNHKSDFTKMDGGTLSISDDTQVDYDVTPFGHKFINIIEYKHANND